MKSSRFIGIVCLFCLATAVWGQEKDLEQEFEDFKREQEQEFDKFRDEMNKEFADFLRQTWDEFVASTPVIREEKPEPVEPIKYDTSKKEFQPVEILPAGIKSYTPEERKQEPLVPLDVTLVGKVSRLTVPFFGNDVAVAVGTASELSLITIGESDVSDAWTKLCSNNNYQLLIQDCMQIKDKLRLNDWAYVELARSIASKVYNDSRPNERAFLEMFILTQSGYRVKIAKIGNQLSLILATSGMIYGAPYITIGGVNYYICEHLGDRASKGIFTYRNEFANSKTLIDLHIQQSLNFETDEFQHTFTAKENALEIKSEVNMNLINFYKKYPQCDLEVYARTPMSKELKETIFPIFRQAISGKSKTEAVSVILNFVQTAFGYKTDREQFGYEKPFFLDEVFYYPYNDCEDRAILFSFLVKDLLKLDTVLLDYPQHIATAVCFDEDIKGDYLTIEGKKYTICDPTFIGAPIGACMPEFRDVSPKIIK